MENGKKPDDNELLAFLDGELSIERQAEIRQQLEADWELRARLNRLEQRVLDYVNATAHHSIADLPPFDDFWQGISARLSDAEAAGSASATKVKRPLLRWVSDTFERVTENRRRLAFGVSFGLLAIFFVSLLVFRTERRVSAHELLERTQQAETLRLSTIAEPVVYQKIRISRRGAAAGGGEEAILWESWNDPRGGKFRQRVADARGLRFVREGEANKAELLSELEEIFRDNQLDLRRPLSAAAFAEWRAAVRHRAESVTEVSLPGNEAAAGLKLTTEVKGVGWPNAIIESSLVVRVSDWHAVARHFRVRKENEIREYELSETAWEALPAQALAIFEEAAPTPSPVASLSPTLAIKPSIVALLPSPAPMPSEAELKESEVAALYALHQLKADLGEPLEIIRQDGQVVVRGQVETTERKRELIAAMKAIPFVASQIQTFDEAAAPTARTQAPQATVAATDSGGVTAAMPGVNQFERRLARYFAERNTAAPKNTEANTEATDRQIAQLSNDVFAESSAALANAWALRRLAERFNENADEPINSEAARRLREIMGNHLAEIRTRQRNLRARLEPALIFVAGAQTTAVPSSEVPGATRKERVMQLFRAVEQVHQLTYRLFDSGPSFAASPEQAARQALQALAQLDATLPALEQEARK